MEVKAKLKYLRATPRKMRLVADYIRGKMVSEVIADLSLTPIKGARLMVPLVKSAIANAGKKVDVDTLYVKTVFVGDGGVMKRFMPRAHGRATQINKKFCHVTLVLDEK